MPNVPLNVISQASICQPVSMIDFLNVTNDIQYTNNYDINYLKKMKNWIL